MEPMLVVPIQQALRVDSTNGLQLGTLLGWEFVGVANEHVRLQVAPDEVMPLPIGCWVLLTVAPPGELARLIDVVPDNQVRTRVALHPGAVSPIPPAPPADEEPVTP